MERVTNQAAELVSPTPPIPMAASQAGSPPIVTPITARSTAHMAASQARSVRNGFGNRPISGIVRKRTYPRKRIGSPASGPSISGSSNHGMSVMKRSNPGRASMAAMLVGLGVLGATGAVPGGALAQETTYQPWSGAQTQTQAATQTSDQKLQTLVTDLNGLIKKAEAAKAADPNFLADLKKLAARYPVTPSLGGPGTVFLSDNFSDGNYTASPVWKVSAGTWKVDTKGSTQGLSSTIGAPASNKISGNDVLQAILGVQQQQAPQSTYASIYTSVPIANAFKMTMKIVSASKS